MKRQEKTRGQKALGQVDMDGKPIKRREEMEAHREETDSVRAGPVTSVAKGIKSQVENYRLRKEELKKIHGRPRGGAKKSGNQTDYWKPKRIDDEAAKQAGYTSRGNAERDEYLVNHGDAAIITRIDAGDLSRNKAHGLVKKQLLNVPVAPADDAQSEATSDNTDDQMADLKEVPPVPADDAKTDTTSDSTDGQKADLKEVPPVPADDAKSEATSHNTDGQMADLKEVPAVPADDAKSEATSDNTDVAVAAEVKTEDLREFLMKWKGAPDDPSAVTDAMLRRWTAAEVANTREANRIAYHKGLALNYRKANLPKGTKIGDWENEMEGVVGKGVTTMRLYMRLARFVDKHSATALPRLVLDRPLREVPRAIRNVVYGNEPDFKPEPTVLTVEQKVTKWRERYQKLLKEAENDPDLKDVRNEMMGISDRDDESENVPITGGTTSTAKAIVACPKTSDRSPLHLRYHPRRFEDVIGNNTAVKTMSEFARARKPGVILLSGPSGTGKTTLARLCARSFLCEGDRPNGYDYCGECEECKAVEKPNMIDMLMGLEVEEMSAADYPDGNHAVQAFFDVLHHAGRPILVNEADRLLIAHHRLLSRMEKILKWPIFFTTTHPHRMDDQFRGRCILVETKPVEKEVLKEYLRSIALNEGHDLTDEQIEEIFGDLKKRGAMGRVRDALMELEKCLLIAAYNKRS